MRPSETLPPDDIQKLDNAMALVKQFGRDFTGGYDSREAQFVFACIDLLEIQIRLLKLMPSTLTAAALSLETERNKLNAILQKSTDAISTINKINENAVRKQVLDLTSQVFAALSPEIENRARIVNTVYSLKTLSWFFTGVIALTLFVFFLGRISV